VLHCLRSFPFFFLCLPSLIDAEGVQPPAWLSFLAYTVNFNAKVGGLNMVTHAQRALFVVHPALQLARQCKCQAIIAAGMPPAR